MKNQFSIFYFCSFFLLACGDNNIAIGTSDGTSSSNNTSTTTFALNPSNSIIGIGGSITISISGGKTPYSYTPTNGTFTNGVFTPTAIGAASLTVHDGTSATLSANFTVKGANSNFNLSGDTSYAWLSSAEAQTFGYDPYQTFAGNLASDFGHDTPTVVAATHFPATTRFTAFATKARGSIYDWGCVSNSSIGVQCWGDNTNGTIGDGTTTIRGVPVTVGSLSPMSKIVFGRAHVCAMMSNGNVYCWGNNDFGQVGANTAADNCGTGHTCALVPVQITTNLANGRVLDIAAGGDTTCVVDQFGTNTGAVKCWGDNSKGQYGSGSTSIGGSTATASLISGATASQVVLTNNGDGGCALVGTAVKCWGGVGQSAGEVVGLALGGSATPATISGWGSNISTVVAGDENVCVLQSGAVQCFGIGASGANGNGSLANASTPVTVSGLASITSLFAGSKHYCARDATFRLYCWGSNSGGQLGQGTQTNSDIPVSITAWK